MVRTEVLVVSTVGYHVMGAREQQSSHGTDWVRIGALPLLKERNLHRIRCAGKVKFDHRLVLLDVVRCTFYALKRVFYLYQLAQSTVRGWNCDQANQNA